MTDDVNALRPRMMSVAYRMLGSVVDAEDAVQDAFVRDQTAGGVSSPEGFLIRSDDIDRLAVLAKATAELLDRGQSAESASRQLQKLRDLLEALL
jgi:RNA polymerase sigma-70 factor (ECF subfamily)